MPKHSFVSSSVSAMVGAAILLTGMMAPSCAETAQVHVTLVKSRHAVQGFGNLFYDGERYRLQLEGIAAKSLKSSRSDLIGSAENVRAASDVLGTYEAAESGGSTVLDNGKDVRLKNKNGVVLDMRGTNLGRQSLDLAGLTVTSRGWGSDSKERNGH